MSVNDQEDFDLMSEANPEPDQELTPVSGHGKMPLVLLGFWIANIAFFFYYFVKFGLADLGDWLSK
jgi:hypothetical protein